MKKFMCSLVAILVLSTTSAFAAGDFGIEAGFRQQSGDTSAGTSASSQLGYQFGGVASFAISGPYYFHTGLLYTQRPLKITGSPDVKYSLNYVDIPLTLMYKFEDYAGVFGGVTAALNLDSSADNGTSVTNVKSNLFPVIVGATFKFAPQLGGTIYYETQSGDVATGLKNYRAVGANLLITFE